MDLTDRGTETCVVPSVPSSVARLRRFAVEQCRLSGRPVDCDTLALLVSEVATNALIHSRGDVRLSVLPDSSGVRAEVHDEGQGMPTPREPGLDAEGGRGLGLVETLAARWGTDPTREGKTVWFELDA
jgi:anti-sigma regulatory factor (Ser/Thr protein kinase)